MSTTVRSDLTVSSGFAQPAKAIISPFLDVFCCGALSISVIIGFFIYALVQPGNPLTNASFSMQKFLIANFLINYPHLMASFLLLYSKKEQVMEYKWASIYLPAMLALVIGYALLTPGDQFANVTVVNLIGLASILFLAWHYTGQAWGMIASFSYISGIRMDERERWLIRSACRVLLVWHIIWALLPVDGVLSSSLPTWAIHFRGIVRTLYLAWTVPVLATIPLGIYGFWRIKKRTGQTPPVRAIVPWVALYFWYALLFFYPGAYLVVQIAHALQYLVFPIRVEMNRHSQDTQASEQQQAIRGIAYYVVLVAIGAVVFLVPHVGRMFGDSNLQLLALVAGFVSLHHYATDGVIWKISNPRVRKELFAHLTN